MELDVKTMSMLSLMIGSDAIELQEKLGQNSLRNNEKLPIKCHDYGYFKKLHDIGIVILDTEEEINNKFSKNELFMSVKLPEGWSIKPTDHSMWSNLVDDKGRARASIFYKAAFYDRDAHLNFNRRFRISGKQADYDEKQFEYKQEYIIDGYKTEWVEEEIKDGYSWYGSNCKQMKQVDKPIYKKNPEYVELTGYEKYSQPFHYEVYDFDETILFKSDIVKTDFEYSNNKHWEFFDHLKEIEDKSIGQCKEWFNINYPDWENDLAYWD